MLLSLSKVFLFSNKANFNSGVGYYWNCTLINSHEINEYGIQIYQSTFELLHFCFRMWSGCRIEQSYWRSTGLAKKRHGSADLQSPIYPPLLYLSDQFFSKNSQAKSFLSKQKIENIRTCSKVPRVSGKRIGDIFSTVVTLLEAH